MLRHHPTSLIRALTAGLLCLASAACEPQGPVVIAVTGSYNFLEAGAIAYEHAVAEASVPGLDTVMVQEGSNQSGPAIRDADRLVQIPGIVAVVGHSNSAASIAASQIYRNHRVVQLAPSSTAPAYSQTGPFSFRMVPPDDEQGGFLVEALREMLPGGGRVALFYVNDEYGRGLRQAVAENLDQDEYPLVLELPHDETDVTPEEIEHAGAALEEAEPDAILWLARGTILRLFIPTIREAAGPVPILGGDATITVLPLNRSSGIWDEVWFADFVDLDATEALRAFRDEYAARAPNPPGGTEALTYDAVRLLIEGVRAGARSGEEMREYLISLGRTRPPYQGITGPIQFDEEGDADRSYVLRSMVGG